MHRIDILKRRIQTAEDLKSIVKTMKGLAAVSISQYEHAVDSITQYYLTIEQGLQIILKKEPGLASFFQHPAASKEPDQRIAVVFGAGQPMHGMFNKFLATFFQQQLNDLPDGYYKKVIAVGHRIASNIGPEYPHHIFDMPTTIEHINETVQALVMAIQKWHEEGYNEVCLFYNRPEANAGYKPVMQQLLPVDTNWLNQLSQQKWEGRSIPTYTMDATQLVSVLIKQLLFVTVYKAFAESLSAENNSRLVSMQQAEQKITDMITELTQTYRSQRQINITEEILDIIASFEALQKEYGDKFT